MEVYTKMCPLVWWVMGTLDRVNQTCPEEDIIGRIHVSLIVLEILVIKIKAILNDQPLMYTPSEFDEMNLLTPAGR